LSEHRLELPSTHGKGLFDTEKLGKLLQEVRGFLRGEVDARVNGPQFDLALATRGIDEGHEGLLAKDGAQGPFLNGVAPIKDPAILCRDAGTQVAVSLGSQEEFH
jgi:hypothetical protein